MGRCCRCCTSMATRSQIPRSWRVFRVKSWNRCSTDTAASRHFVEGDDPATMHQRMASVLEQCINEIQSHSEARSFDRGIRAPALADGRPSFTERMDWTERSRWTKVEDFWRAHQVPVLDPVTNNRSLKQIVEEWMRSYKPEELFDDNGALIPELQELAPEGASHLCKPAREWWFTAQGTRTARLSQLCRQGRSNRAQIIAPPTDDRSALSCAKSCAETWTTSGFSVRTRTPPTGSRRSTQLKESMACRIQAGRR